MSFLLMEVEGFDQGLQMFYMLSLYPLFVVDVLSVIVDEGVGRRIVMDILLVWNTIDQKV